MEISPTTIKPNTTALTTIKQNCECSTNSFANTSVTAEQLFNQSSFNNMFASTENVFRALTKITQPAQSLFPSSSDDGQVVVRTEDNYRLTFDTKNEQWTIQYPDGRQTRIWGDPHVEESDGDKWDFTEKSSFIFGNNKATVETTPIVNGASYSQTVTIYNGEDRLTITDLHKNKPSIVSWKFDAKSHDSSIADGTTYSLKRDNLGNESWLKPS